ncbi:MAG: hypothetical protein M0R47_19490, partial [Methylobacter sp.]|nr:hypothetical protein [Methylobacter sp.]
MAEKIWQPQPFQMMIKATGLSNAFLLDYDGSNSFPSIVKGIIETTQKVRGQGNRAIFSFSQRPVRRDNNHSNKHAVFVGVGCLCWGCCYSTNSRP